MNSIAHSIKGDGKTASTNVWSTQIQPKLTVNAPGDRYEQEADAMADRVMRMPFGQASVRPTQGLQAASVQRKCAHCEQEEREKVKVMRKAESGGGFQAPAGLASSLSTTKGGGSPLPDSTMNFMENAFSTDFSRVRVHTDGQAASMSQGIQARAFTHGSDVYFNSGQYQPESEGGRRLLAHELTHVVQQGGTSSVSIQRQEIPESIRNLNPSCTVNWQPVWERRFDPARDISCGANTPLGRVSTSDIYQAYQYIFGNRPPGGRTTTGGTGERCPSGSRIPWGGCCPNGRLFNAVQFRCEEAINFMDLPCPTGQRRTSLGLCQPDLPALIPSMSQRRPPLSGLGIGLMLPPFPIPFSGGDLTSSIVDQFAQNSAAMPSNADAVLLPLVPAINSLDNGAIVHIDGHASSEGTAQRNYQVSLERANSVRDRLIALGVTDAGRLHPEGNGAASRIVDADTTESARSQNRRVEIWFFENSGMPRFQLRMPTLQLPSFRQSE